MTKRELRELLEEALVEWASEQRDARGDIFATAQDLENIKGDPLAFGTLLQGEDAYGLLRRVLAIQERREEAAQEAVQAAWYRTQTFYINGYQLRYDPATGEWTDGGGLVFHDNASGWPVDTDGNILDSRFYKGER